MISILLITKNMNQVAIMSEFCKQEKYLFFFLKEEKQARKFLLNEQITVAIVNTDVVSEPADFITNIRERGCNTSLILIAEKSFSDARKLLKMGYYDYLPLDYSKEMLFASLEEAIENIFAFEKIKGLTEELEKTNKSLQEKTIALEEETIRLKSYVSLMNTVDVFVKEVNSEQNLKGIINVLFNYLEKYFFERIIILTMIEDMQEYIVASYNINIGSINHMRWDLTNLSNTPWATSILEHRETVLVEHPLEDAWYSKSDIVTVFPYGFIKLPLYTSSSVVGTIMISLSSESKQFSQEEEIFLNLIKEHVAIAIENINLNKKLKQANKQIIESEKIATMAKFAVSVNHEINNPLCAISLNIELLKRRCKDEEFQQIFKAIDTNIEKINEITNKISNLKKIVVKEYLPGIDMIDLENSN
jgi:DNA-binding response OmpR family regulator/two-component sensor histidine kinase